MGERCEGAQVCASDERWQDEKDGKGKGVRFFFSRGARTINLRQRGCHTLLVTPLLGCIRPAVKIYYGEESDPTGYIRKGA